MSRYNVTRGRGHDMMYDILGEYRDYLKKNFCDETARTYANRIEILLKRQSILDPVKNLNTEEIITKLSKIKYKNEFSQSKNAFLHFLEFQQITLSEDHLKQIEQLEKSTYKKYRQHKSIDYKTIDKTIKHLRDQKLKICYQTLLSTGLRVFELSQIKRENCLIVNDSIQLNFVGKGGEKENVTILKRENKLLYENLQELIDKTNLGEKVFYSANYLQRKAREHNFCCHDLRRIYAQLELKKTKSKKTVQEKLRHTNEKTADIYLKSDIQM